MNYDDDDVGALRGRRRSAQRTVEVETDPRFLARGPVGRVAPTLNNWGSSCRLNGFVPGDTRKLLRLETPAGSPLVVSVSAVTSGITVDPPFGLMSAGIRVSGNFGTGGSFNKVVFDARPDQSIQLPGGSIDLDVSWDTEFRGTAASSGGAAEEVLNALALPTFADISGVACHGTTSRGTATRTLPFFPFVAVGNWTIPIPPYADELGVYLSNDASYVNLGTVEILTSLGVGAAPLAEYTGATLLAMKNAGAMIPLPGNASHVRITTVGPGLFNSRLVYNLSL